MPAQKTKKAAAPDMSVATQPSVRVFTTWTPGLIRTAEISADSGNLRYAANLCDWLLADDRVASTLRSRTQALLGLTPTFERAGDGRRSGRPIKALEAGDDWWGSYPEAELSLFLSWGLLLGAAPGRHRWALDEASGRRRPLPEFWHPQHLSYDWKDRRWLIDVASGSFGIEQRELVAGDGEWLLHTPFGGGRPWAMGLWRGLGYLVLLKHLAQQDWSRVGEKGALLVLTTDREAAKELQGNTKEMRRQLAQDIYARGREAVAALPPGIDLKLVETAANTQDLYNAQIEMANEAIAICVRGGNLTTNVKEGSRAAITEQSRVGDLGNLRFDAQALTTTIHDQSLVWWASFNFGDAALAPWPVYPVEPKADLKAKAETTEKALANLDTAEKLGLEVDRQAFLEEHEIDWAKPGSRPEPEPVAPPPVPAEPGAGPQSSELQPQPKPPEKPQQRAVETERAAGAVDQGQDYAERLTESAMSHAARELGPTVAAMLSAVERATSYEEARAAIVERYAGLASPVDLAVLTESSIILAQLAGRLAVTEETPETGD